MYREHEREETKKIDRWIIDTERKRETEKGNRLDRQTSRQANAVFGKS